jgi:hypothetical protein
LRFRRNETHPVGLYDLHRRIRPVGIAYRELVARWKAGEGATEMRAGEQRAELA